MLTSIRRGWCLSAAKATRATTVDTVLQFAKDPASTALVLLPTLASVRIILVARPAQQVSSLTFISFILCFHPACPDGRWGVGCNQVCACLHNASCDPVSGACTCSPGWRGDHCEKPCPQGQYGLDCKESCKCENGVSCDTESGSCTCQSGWMGALCDQPCPVGKHGTNCTSSCQCQNEGRCHPETGHCQCKPGWEVKTPQAHFIWFLILNLSSRDLSAPTRAPPAVTGLVVKRNASATTAPAVILSMETATVSPATRALR